MAKEQRKSLLLARKRYLELGFLFTGTPISLDHDEWLRKERRKSSKAKRKSESRMEWMDLTGAGVGHNQYDDESSDGSARTIKPTDTTVCPPLCYYREGK
jgi:hypothetical protein